MAHNIDPAAISEALNFSNLLWVFAIKQISFASKVIFSLSYTLNSLRNLSKYVKGLSKLRSNDKFWRIFFSRSITFSLVTRSLSFDVKSFIVILIEGVKGYSIFAARITQVTYRIDKESYPISLSSWGKDNTLSKILMARWIVSCLYFLAWQRLTILSE